MKEINSETLKNMILEYIEDNKDISEYYRTFPVINLENEFIIYNQFDGNIFFHDTNYYCVLIQEMYFLKNGEPKNNKIILFKAFEYLY